MGAHPNISCESDRWGNPSRLSPHLRCLRLAKSSLLYARENEVFPGKMNILVLGIISEVMEITSKDIERSHEKELSDSAAYYTRLQSLIETQ